MKKLGDVKVLIAVNGGPTKTEADSTHIYLASRYNGYFITLDKRLLKKAKEVEILCGAKIATPSELLAYVNSSVEKLTNQKNAGYPGAGAGVPIE